MYTNDIETLIRKRISVRKYSSTRVNEKDKETLLTYANELSNEMYRYVMVEADPKENVKISTYGYIKNATDYLVAIADKSLGTDNVTAVQFGYDFEKIVLKATDMGIGTCWMGAAYKEKDLNKWAGATVNERVAMITPVGYQEGRHLFEKITRAAIKADKRKDFGEVFFDDTMDKGMAYDETKAIHKALEMVRLAPSAGNGQPWRVVRSGNHYDFYAKGVKFYDNMKNKKVDFTHNDMGIAKLHFELLLDEEGVKYEWTQRKVEIPEEHKYIGSYVLN